MVKNLDQHTMPDNQDRDYNSHFIEADSSTRSYAKPDAALAQNLHAMQVNASVATRVPKLRLSALALIGIILFGALQALLLHSVMIGVAGAGAVTGHLLAPLTVLTWVAGIGVAIILLNTKNVRLARQIVVVGGLLFAYWTLSSLVHFDIIGLAINGYILWWIYDLYQSLDALLFKV